MAGTAHTPYLIFVNNPYTGRIDGRIKPSSPCADGLIEGKCELSIKYATTEIKVPSGFQLPVGEVRDVAHTVPLIYTAEKDITLQDGWKHWFFFLNGFLYTKVQVKPRASRMSVGTIRAIVSGSTSPKEYEAFILPKGKTM
jgi:hypothetical protein